MSEIKLKADSGGGTVSFKGPATTTSNAAVQLTLPVDDGTANQYLKTDGSGALSWATVDTSIADDSIVEAKLDVSNAPTNGHFLQAQSGEGGGLTWAAGGLLFNWNYTTDNTHKTLDSAGDIYTELNTSITPSSASSRIIVIVNLGLVGTDSAADIGWDVLRDSTALEQGQGGTVNSTCGAFMNQGDGDAFSSTCILVDHPNTTNSVTYKVASDANNPRDMIINRRGSSTDLGVSSRMFLIEIGNKS